MHGKTLEGFDPAAFFKKGLTFCSADLVIGGDTDHIIGRVASYLMCAPDNSGRLVFPYPAFILPPQTIWNRSDKDIWAQVAKGLEELRGTPADDKEVLAIEHRIKIRRTKGLRVEDVVTELNAEADSNLFMIPFAHVYRDPGIVESVKLGKIGVLLDESIWVPHIASLARQCIAASQISSSYVFMEVPNYPPALEVNSKVLFDVDELYITHISYGDKISAGEVLAKNSTRWGALIGTGRVDEAVAEAALLNLSECDFAQIEVQLLARSGDMGRTTTAIRNHVTRGVRFPTELKARLGRFAQKGGDRELAARLILEGFEWVADEDVLADVLHSCTLMENKELEEKLYKRLLELFPYSTRLSENREFRLIKICACQGKADCISTIGFDELESDIFNVASSLVPFDHDSLINSKHVRSESERDLVRICCAVHAEACGEPFLALSIALEISNSWKFSRRAVCLVLNLTRDLLLRNAVDPSEIEIYLYPINYIIHHVSSRPEDAEIRAELRSLLEVDVSGEVGLQLMAAQALQMARKERKSIRSNSVASVAASPQEYLRYIERAFTWMSKQTAIEVGVTKLPVHLVPDNAKELLEAIISASDEICKNHFDEDDLDIAEKNIHLACMLATHVSDTTSDLKALRLLACRYAFEGKRQKARDLAEQALRLAGDDIRRQRVAWTAYSDIYERMHGGVDALLGLACALDLDQEMPGEDLWWEAYTLLRVTRDLGLISFAKDLLPVCRGLLEGLGIHDRYGRRVDHLELSLRLMEQSDTDVVALRDIVMDIAAYCQLAMAGDEEILPAAALLGGALSQYEYQIKEEEPFARDILEKAYDLLTDDQVQYLKSMLSFTPSAREVLDLYSRSDKARYSEDVPSDLVPVVRAARRLLRHSFETLDKVGAAIAIELLADRAVRSAYGHVEPELQWPLKFASKLQSENLAVQMAALDNDGFLVLVSTSDGSSDLVRQQSNVPFQKQLQQWSEKYPFRYGLIDRQDGNNEFFVTMEAIQVPLPDAERIVVVAEPALQQITLNLLVNGNGFVGDVKAIGYAPSLAWLDSVRRSPRNGDTRRMAWISLAKDPENAQTLDVMLGWLKPTLDNHGFETNSDDTIPSNFSGSHIAVIGARGRLNFGDKFLHQIANEESLVESPRKLAGALAKVELVILFVCSGGRTDTHPYFNTAIGLPKLLLAEGCRTVIASAWPLSVNVAEPWLDVFMRAWDEGGGRTERNVFSK